MAFARTKAFIKSRPSLRWIVPLARWPRRGYGCLQRFLAWLIFELPVELFHNLLAPVRFVQFFVHYRWLDKVGRHQIGIPERHQGPRRIVMLVNSDLRMDPRVMREAKALAQGGYLVTVLCPEWSPTPAALQISWGPGIEFCLVPMAYARFNLHFPYLYGRDLIEAAVALDAWAYHAHDLDMAMIALTAAARKKVACVCDFHEWYSENVSWNRWAQRYRPHPFYKRWVYRAMERLALRSATEVITVCDSIGDRMASVYQHPRHIHIIRNIPEMQAAPTPPCDLRAELGISPDTKIILYQGGMGPSRNLEPVIRSFAHVDGAVFVIRGPGFHPFAGQYHEMAQRHGLRDRLFCLPPVPSAQVVAEARAADAGVWTLLANVGFNFKYALPNKVFEYLAAGLPILAADLPEVRKIVLGYEVGLCFDPEDPKSIAAAINRMTHDTAFLNRCRANMAHAIQDLRADEEWQKLVELYDALGKGCQVARLARAG